jgi:hypothetical protein
MLRLLKKESMSNCICQFAKKQMVVFVCNLRPYGDCNMLALWLQPDKVMVRLLLLVSYSLQPGICVVICDYNMVTM